MKTKQILSGRNLAKNTGVFLPLGESLMKKIISLAKTDIFISMMPILGWYIVGFVYGDSDLASIFTLTYSYQFIQLIVHGLITTGSIKYLKKNNIEDVSMAYCAILESFLIMCVVTLLVGLNIDALLLYFGVSAKYKPFYILSVFILSLETITDGIARLKQYEEKDNQAFNLTIVYHIYKSVTIVITGLLIGKYNINLAVLIEAILLFVYVLVMVFKNFKIKKLYINCFRGIMIESNNLVSYISMFAIYFFGLQKVISYSPGFLIAYNMYCMCSDTQRDILYSAIDTKTSLDVCDNKYDKEKKKIYLNNALYGVLLFASCAIMILISSLFMVFDLKIACLVLVIECATFPLTALEYTFASWLKIRYSGVWLIIQSALSCIVRLVLSFVIAGSYALSFGVLINSIFSFTTIALLYIWQKHKKNSIEIKPLEVYNN